MVRNSRVTFLTMGLPLLKRSIAARPAENGGPALPLAVRLINPPALCDFLIAPASDSYLTCKPKRERVPPAAIRGGPLARLSTGWAEGPAPDAPP